MPGPRARCSRDLVLADGERAELEHWQRSTTVAHGLVQRGAIVLGLADGLPVSAVARRVGVQRRIARKWGERFLAHRLAGLTDLPRAGRPPGFPPGGDGRSGPAGLRVAGPSGPLPLAVGLPRTGPAGGRRRGGHGDLGRNGAPPPGSP
ncbi:MAG: helix-turn-helix domain-containing protein [Thermomicrobiales bacterium]